MAELIGVKVGKKYLIQTPFTATVVRVLGVEVFDGKTLIHVIPTFANYGDDFYVGEDEIADWVGQ